MAFVVAGILLMLPQAAGAAATRTSGVPATHGTSSVDPSATLHRGSTTIHNGTSTTIHNGTSTTIHNGTTTTVHHGTTTTVHHGTTTTVHHGTTTTVTVLGTTVVANTTTTARGTSTTMAGGSSTTATVLANVVTGTTFDPDATNTLPFTGTPSHTGVLFFLGISLLLLGGLLVAASTGRLHGLHYRRP